jgi:hypothetical protein
MAFASFKLYQLFVLHVPLLITFRHGLQLFLFAAILLRIKTRRQGKTTLTIEEGLLKKSVMPDSILMASFFRQKII